MELLPIRCIATGKAEPFFIFRQKQNLFVMLYTEKPCLSLSNTPTERNAVEYSKFLIEKEAKNTAYSFILSSGLYEQFRDFCRTADGKNHHENCVSVFENAVNGNNNIAAINSIIVKIDKCPQDIISALSKMIKKGVNYE
jgi:hypothetical protein